MTRVIIFLLQNVCKINEPISTEPVIGRAISCLFVLKSANVNQDRKVKEAFPIVQFNLSKNEN